MLAKATQDYPWRALPKVPKATLGALTRARRQVSGVLDETRVASALAALTGVDVAIGVRGVELGAPADRFVRVSLVCGGARVTAGVSPELAVALLSRVLGRPLALSRHDAELDPALSGALAALAVETALRVASEPVTLGAPLGEDGALRLDLKVLLDGRPYAAFALLPVEASVAGELDGPALAELGNVPVALPLVVALSLATRDELRRLLPGSAWLPGEGAFIDRRGTGRGVLAAPASERGVWVDLTPDGKVVLRGGLAELAAEAPRSGEEANMAEAAKEGALAEAVLEAPVVVRVELGTVSMAASDWAKLKPGDVIETGTRVGEPAVLRIAGRAVARGELVDVDGELGVRVRELLRE